MQAKLVHASNNGLGHRDICMPALTFSRLRAKHLFVDSIVACCVNRESWIIGGLALSEIWSVLAQVLRVYSETMYFAE